MFNTHIGAKPEPKGSSVADPYAAGSAPETSRNLGKEGLTLSRS
jgi:hypothetical protein